MYSPERSFKTRKLANEYLDSVYAGVWKFQRTRKTKMGSKCFFKCKLSENCKSKIFILSQENTDRVALFKNNIDHAHTNSPQSSIKNISTNGFFSIASSSNGENQTGNDSFNAFLDENSNDSYDEDNDDDLSKFRHQHNLSANRFELAYTAEESFENRQSANQFIDSLNLWKFQRTRSTKKGAKCFYGCKLNRDCKSKIYVLSYPDSEKVTIFRNNIDHDHTNSRNRSVLSSNRLMVDLTKASSNEENSVTYLSKVETYNDLASGLSNENHYDNEIGSLSKIGNNIKNKIGMRFDFNYSAEKTFQNRLIGTKYIESLGTWKFERHRSTKMGSKGFYHCKVTDSCKSKIYLLSEPNVERVTLFRNNVEHDHSNSTRKNSTQNRTNAIATSLNYSMNDKFDEHLMHKDNLLSGPNEADCILTDGQNETENGYFYENNINEDNKNYDEEDLQVDEYFHNNELNQDIQSDSENEFFDEENPELDENFSEHNDEDDEDVQDNLASNPEEICFSDENSNRANDEDTKSKTCLRENPVYIAEKSFENKQLSNRYVDSLGIWRFDRLRDSKAGIKGFYQCKVSDFCKSKIYLLFHPDSEKVTLYKNSIDHDHTIKKSKKWGISSLTKKLIDEVYLSGNTKPMSCLFKVRSLIKAKTEKLNMEKLNGNDVTDLENELDQLDVPGMMVLKNYINNTLKPKLNGQKEILNSEATGNFNLLNIFISLKQRNFV